MIEKSEIRMGMVPSQNCGEESSDICLDCPKLKKVFDSLSIEAPLGIGSINFPACQEGEIEGVALKLLGRINFSIKLPIRTVYAIYSSAKFLEVKKKHVNTVYVRDLLGRCPRGQNGNVGKQVKHKYGMLKW